MAGTVNETIRPPAVAGTFYPADADQCRGLAAQFIAAGKSALSAGRLSTRPGIGAIVPHAGWICSGAIAAEAIAVLAIQRPKVDLVVVFGAIHTPIAADHGILDDFGKWATPGGLSVVGEVRQRLAEQAGLFAVDDRFHRTEHAVEVELPLIQQAWPRATILPVEVPPSEDAVRLGELVAKAIDATGLSEIYLASSDLTHYGPNYRFMPAGVGEAALNWAMDNDRRMLQIVMQMSPQRVVPEARSRLNACGAGAIAAMLAASMSRGRDQCCRFATCE